MEENGGKTMTTGELWERNTQQRRRKREEKAKQKQTVTQRDEGKRSVPDGRRGFLFAGTNENDTKARLMRTTATNGGSESGDKRDCARQSEANEQTNKQTNTERALARI